MRTYTPSHVSNCACGPCWQERNGLHTPTSSVRKRPQIDPVFNALLLQEWRKDPDHQTPMWVDVATGILAANIVKSIFSSSKK